MTISSSMNAGVLGLAANANRLATISDNIANSSTHGYRRVETDFHSMVIGSGGGTYSAGGVRTTNHRMIDMAGSVISTSNPTDLAVDGRGMLPVARYLGHDSVQNGTEMLLTTTGAFRMDKDGYLVTESGLVLLGWPASKDGTIPTFPRDTSDGLKPIRIEAQQLAGEPTTKISFAANLPATDTDPSGNGDARTISIEYFDNLGKAENLKVEFRPVLGEDTHSNTWEMVIKDSASNNNETGKYKIEFNDDRENGGSLKSVTAVEGSSGGAYDPTTGSLSISVAGGPIDITIGKLGESRGLTQKSDKFTPAAIDKDGSPVGNMTSLVQIDGAGNVYATYDTGESRLIYQIPLVDLPNRNGLTSYNNQTYAPSKDSGRFFLWNAGDGPTGQILPNALEESTTDVAAELTKMIQTQRSYSSNAKVIQTANEILQETTNIIR